MIFVLRLFLKMQDAPVTAGIVVVWSRVERTHDHQLKKTKKNMFVLFLLWQQTVEYKAFITINRIMAKQFFEF